MDDEHKQKIRAALERVLEAEGDQFRRIEALVEEATGDNVIRRQIIMTLIQSVRISGAYDGIAMMLDGGDIAKITAQLSQEQREVTARIFELFEMEAEQMEKEAGKEE